MLAVLGTAAVAMPLVARAQQPSGKIPVIGFLGTGTALSQGAWLAAFVQRLRELGWIENRSVTIETLWAEGRNERAAGIATELVRRNVDVIVTSGTAVETAKHATSLIPIVFSIAVDPVGSGFVASLGRPGSNVTGLSVQGTDVAGKRLELLREAHPDLRHLAIVVNAGYPAAGKELSEIEAASRKLNLETTTLGIRRGEDIQPAFVSIGGRANALYIVSESLTNANRVRINTLAASARLPSISAFREFVEAGGLMSYGPSYTDLFRRSADFVDKILRGTKPADIPVEQPTKFELAINLAIARALGLTISPSLLSRADEVIE